MKVLIASHIPSVYPDVPEFLPIRTGAVNAAPSEPSFRMHALSVANDMQAPPYRDAPFFSDDTGDNVSSQNGKLCELSALYWGWKNLQFFYDPEHIGLMHYRRWFVFRDHPKKNIFQEYPSSRFVAEQYHDVDCSGMVRSFDICAPYPSTYYGGAYKQYITEHKNNHLDMALDILADKYPEYADNAKRYLKKGPAYFYNMSIMRRSLFQEYCEWLFDVLFTLDAQVDWSTKSAFEQRDLGFIGERLTSVFIRHKLAAGKCAVRHLPVVSFVNASPLPRVTPSCKTSKMICVIPATNDTVPAAAATLLSVGKNLSQEGTLDVAIIADDISVENTFRLRFQMRSFSNLHLRFVDAKLAHWAMKDYLERMQLPHAIHGATWCLPLFVCNGFKKILYLDAGALALADIRLLEAFPLEGAGVGFAPDYAALIAAQQPLNAIPPLSSVALLDGGYVKTRSEGMEDKTKRVDKGWLLELLSGKRHTLLPGQWGVRASGDDNGGTVADALFRLHPVDVYTAYMEARQEPRIIVYENTHRSLPESSGDLPWFLG